MSDSNSIWLGLEFLLGGLVLGWGVTLVNRFFPSISEKKLKATAGCLLGAFLIAKGLWGLSVTGSAIRERLWGLVPHAAVALWMFLAFRFWLTARTARRGMETRIDGLSMELKSAGGLIASNHTWTSRQFEIDREALRNEFVQLWKDQGTRLDAAIAVQAETAMKGLSELGEMLTKGMAEHAKVAAEWEGNTRAELKQHGETTMRLRQAVDLIHLELDKIPKRFNEQFERVRGADTEVHSGGAVTMRPPKFSNISEISYELVKALKRLDAATSVIADLAEDRIKDREYVESKLDLLFKLHAPFGSAGGSKG